MAEGKQQLRILALGDSLTAGHHDHGRTYHPYSIYLTKLFESAKISVQIDQQGISGERVVPNMVNRLKRLLNKNVSYDWIIILGGTNDLADEVSGEKIFRKGLEPIYEMCLNHNHKKTKLAVMTVIENAFDRPTTDDDKDRQTLNTMIRDYVSNSDDQNRICLVDLDEGIPYHTVSDDKDRKQIWDDAIHLTPAGYDRMAVLAFNAIKRKL